MADRAPDTLAVAFPTAQMRPLTGHVELDLGAALAAATRPAKVSGVIKALFSTIGGQPVTSDLVSRLATGARAWLLASAALPFLPGLHWFQTSCSACGQDYDLSLSLGDLPRSNIPAPFPVIEVETSLGARRFEVPNGRTESVLAHTTPDAAPRALAAVCGLSQEAQAEAAQLSDEDLHRIDHQLDAATPDIADAVSTECPTCNAAHEVRIDPLTFAFPAPSRLLGQVHHIARSYSWSEATILDLPSSRRAAYCRLIAGEARP